MIDSHHITGREIGGAAIISKYSNEEVSITLFTAGNHTFSIFSNAQAWEIIEALQNCLKKKTK